MKNQIVIAGRFSYSESNLLFQHSNLKAYKGYDKTTKKDVHIRILESEEELEGVFKSLLELKQAKHTFIVPILELSRPEREKIIMVTEVGRICTLRDALKKSTYMLEQDALVIFKYVLLAMAQLHDKASVCGYLSMDNIELCTYGIAKISYNSYDLTNKHIQAPEVIEGRQRSQASDVYNLGILLYELLYGVNPFSDCKPEDITRNIKRREYSKIKTMSPFGQVISKETMFLLDSMLDYYPENRPTVTSILETLSIQSIPLETEMIMFAKPKTSLLPELLQKKYVVFRASKRMITHPYFSQACYLCLKVENNSFCNLIVPELKMYESDGRRIDHFIDKLTKCQVASNQQTDSFARVLDFDKFKHEVVILSEYTNQGNLFSYLDKRKNQQGWFKPEQVNLMMYLIAIGLKQIIQLGVESLNSLALTRINVSNGRFQLREPSMVSTMVEKKLKEDYTKIDEWAPEIKQYIGDLSKSDIWSFGVIYHYCLVGEMPKFDESQKVLLDHLKVSNANKTTIRRCLEMESGNRLRLNKIHIQDYNQDLLRQLLDEKKEAKLNTEEEEEQLAEQAAGQIFYSPQQQNKRRQRSLYFTAPKRNIFKNYNKTLDESETKPVRTCVKATLVCIFLTVFFFGIYINNAGTKILSSGLQKQVTLPVAKNYGTQLYNLTILATNGSLIAEKYGNYSYQQFIHSLRCFENRFSRDAENSVDNFANGGNLSTLCVLGFAYIIVILIWKILQLQRNDLPFAVLQFQTLKENRGNYILFYFMTELLMCNLLFSHFYIFYLEYVVQNVPCFGLESLAYPRFTSLDLLLTGSTGKYFTQVFLTIILFSMVHLVFLFVVVLVKSLNDNFIKWKLYIPTIVLWLLVFVICRVGFGGPTPLEPTYSYKFNWDILHTYYGFIGLFPQVIMVAVWIIEHFTDLVFFCFLRRGVRVEEMEEEPAKPKVQARPEPIVDYKPQPSEMLIRKDLNDSIEYY